MKTLAAIQIRTPNKLELALSSAERLEIKESHKDSIDVFWLTPAARERDDQVAGYTLSSSILMFLLGVGLSGLVKPLLEGFMGAAGEDMWRGIKSLMKSIWVRQCEKSYDLSSNIIVIVELEEEHAAIEFTIADPPLDRDKLEAYIDNQIHKQVSSLTRDLPRILETIKKFDVGSRFEGHIHIIFCRGGKWSVYGKDAKELLDVVQFKGE